MTDEGSRLSYTADIPYKDLPDFVQLASNLSSLLGLDVRVEKAEALSDTKTNITLYAFLDNSTLMSSQDLLKYV